MRASSLGHNVFLQRTSVTNLYIWPFIPSGPRREPLLKWVGWYQLPTLLPSSTSGSPSHISRTRKNLNSSNGGTCKLCTVVVFCFVFLERPKAAHDFTEFIALYMRIGHAQRRRSRKEGRKEEDILLVIPLRFHVCTTRRKNKSTVCGRVKKSIARRTTLTHTGERVVTS